MLKINKQMCSRFLSTGAAVSKRVLQKLRSETGLPFIKIKEALQENDNNPERALHWLEEKAAEHNWVKAQKLSQRATSQGLVGILKGEAHVSMVSLQCETESVAKNEHFISLLYKTALALQSTQEHGIIFPDSAFDLTVNDEKLSDIRTSTVGRLGENIQAKGCFVYQFNSPNICASSYLHRRTVSDIPGLSLGAIGSLAVFENLNDDVLGTTIAQHIVGSENCDNLLDQPLLQDESVTVGELCKQHNFRILHHCRLSAQ